MNEELILETIKEYLIDDKTRYIKDAVLMAHKKLNAYSSRFKCERVYPKLLQYRENAFGS